MRFRTYDNLPSSTKPLIDGDIPSKAKLKATKRLIVETAEGHVLTEREWADVIIDNFTIMGQLPVPTSPYKLEELKFREYQEEKK